MGLSPYPNEKDDPKSSKPSESCQVKPLKPVWKERKNSEMKEKKVKRGYPDMQNYIINTFHPCSDQSFLFPIIIKPYTGQFLSSLRSLRHLLRLWYRLR